ncbi:MAG: hypothetical protein ACRD35_09135 [Candidatus Acidiferrales bacterium]
MAEAEAAAPAPLKIKTRKPRQRACDEKTDKGKMCAGHMKRFYDFSKATEALARQQAGLGPREPLELYRCHRCGTLYLPLKQESPRSFVLRY